MAQDNEQVCLLAFNIFAFVCVIYSCLGIYDLQKQYQTISEDEEQIACLPYVSWKSGFLVHIIFFFLCLAFSVGTAQAYMDDDHGSGSSRRRQIEEAPPNERMYRLRFDKMIENSLDVIRMCCVSFCGPVILVECIITAVYYRQIVHGCQKIHDGFTNVLVYVLIISGLISLAVTGYCCYSGFMIGKTVRDVWPQILNPPPVAEEDAESIASGDNLSRRNSMVPQAQAPVIDQPNRGRLSARSYVQSDQYRSLRASREHEEHLMREVQNFLLRLQQQENEDQELNRRHQSQRLPQTYSIQNEEIEDEEEDDGEYRPQHQYYQQDHQEQDEEEEEEEDDDYLYQYYYDEETGEQVDEDYHTYEHQNDNGHNGNPNVQGYRTSNARYRTFDYEDEEENEEQEESHLINQRNTNNRYQTSLN